MKARYVQLRRSRTDRLGQSARTFANEAARSAVPIAKLLARRILPGADPEAFLARPYQLNLEFTNLCNAKCVFCPYVLQVREHEFMSERVFKKAVGEFVDSGGGPVSLTPVVGDPLIHPQFVEWVRYLRAIPQIDKITVTTNAILLKKRGVDEILDSGLSAIYISTAGFDEEMYRRIYQSDRYRQFRDGVYQLFEANERRATPIPIFLLFRPDRTAEAVLSDPDLQPLLKYQPKIEILETFSRSGGLISILPAGMKLAPIETDLKRVPCSWTYNGLMVLSNGDVQVCACESNVNADALTVGNIEEESLLSIWHGERLRELRESFRRGSLNGNCSKCDYYTPVDLYTRVARRQAAMSRRRQRGEIVKSSTRIEEPFQFE